MKTIFRFLPLIAILFSVFAANAQNCNYYYPLVENSKMEFRSFNPKDKLESIQEVIVKDVSNAGGVTEATVINKVYDKKNKLLHEGDFGVTCSGSKINIDMTSMLDQSMLAAFEGMEVSMDVNDIVIPADLSVGTKLDDASITMVVKSGGMTITDMTIHIKNRIVESKETVTTPAGTFDTFKLTYDNILVSETMGMTQTVTTKAVEYMVKDLGAVRTESYDADGKLQGYTVLNKVY